MTPDRVAEIMRIWLDRATAGTGIDPLVTELLAEVERAMLGTSDMGGVCRTCKRPWLPSCGCDPDNAKMIGGCPIHGTTEDPHGRGDGS